MNNEDNSFNNQGIMNEEPEQMEEQNFPRANGGGFAQNIKNTAADLMRGVHAGLGRNPMRGQEKPDDKKKKDGLDKKDKDKKDSKDGNKDKKKDNEHKNPLPGAGDKKSKDPRDANDKKPGEKKENNSKEKGGLASRLNPFNRKRGAQQGALGKEKTGGIKEKIGKSFKTGIKKIWTILPIQAKIAIIIIVPMIILLLFLFNILFAALAGASFSALCGTSGSSTYNGEGYTGSADMLDFACSSQHPLANKGLITSWSGPRWGRQHEGVDIGVPTGTPVYAVQAGTVTLAGVEGGYGNSVVIAHTDAISTRYGHNSVLLVKAGDKVAKGQMIAKSGNTGRSTGPHLHFEFVYNGQKQYDLQNQYFGVDEKNGAEYVSSIVGENFKKQCGSKWKGELAGDSASQANDTSDSYVSTSSGSSSANCCVSGSSSSSTTGTDCPNGITVTGDYAGTYDLDDYIQKVVTAENGGANDEALKALAIAARTYALNYTNNCSKSIPNSTAAQVMAETASERVKQVVSSVNGAIMLRNGSVFSAQYSSFWGECNDTECTGRFKKAPTDEWGKEYKMPRSYFTLMGHSNGLSQNGSNYMAAQGKKYDEILKYFYADDVEITGASGNTCSIGGKFDGKIYQYYQTDYNDKLCSNLSTTIHDSGCGPTSMAVVLSSLLKEEHDPIELSKFACSHNRCSNGGCSTELFFDVAKKYNLSVRTIDPKDTGEVKAQLNSGKTMMIALMNQTGSNPFAITTDHFIVLYGIDGNEVAIWDPYRDHNVNDKTYDLDKYFNTTTVWKYWAFSKN